MVCTLCVKGTEGLIHLPLLQLPPVRSAAKCDFLSYENTIDFHALEDLEGLPALHALGGTKWAAVLGTELP
jgi:hypothetical protein